MGTWEHRAILEGNKGTRTPPGRPSQVNFKPESISNQVNFCLFDVSGSFVFNCCVKIMHQTTETEVPFQQQNVKVYVKYTKSFSIRGLSATDPVPSTGMP